MATQTLTVTMTLVIDSLLTLITTSLPRGTVNQPYGPVQLLASGGVSPYSWVATGLPAGLSLSTGGVLSGTPTAGGNYNVTVRVTDSGN